MKHLELQISQVENGYVVFEYPMGKDMAYERPKWVANDIPGLLSLVGDLAARTEVFPVGKRPTQSNEKDAAK